MDNEGPQYDQTEKNFTIWAISSQEIDENIQCLQEGQLSDAFGGYIKNGLVFKYVKCMLYVIM
jgi:hypothetical protein